VILSIRRIKIYSKWGLGIGDWGLGVLGLWANPQPTNHKPTTPTPNKKISK